jgi:multiple sugar transport system permease protein
MGTVSEARGGPKLLDREGFLAVAMLMPAVLYIVFLVGIPFVMAVLFSFSDVSVGSPTIDRFTLETFNDVINDPVFRRSLQNSFVFTLFAQGLVLILATVLAILLNRNFRGKWIVRLLILLPWATPIAIGAINWLWLLDSVYSPLTWILREVGLIGAGALLGPRNVIWLGQETLAMASIIAIHVWRMLPLSTVIILAGLSSIPQDIQDAVQVDGASFLRGWFQVTLPLIRPILMVAMLFGIIFSFTDMTVVHVLTRGNPNNTTQVLASWAFYTGIEGGSLAKGAATAIFLMPVLLGVAILMLRVARRTEVR